MKRSSRLFWLLAGVLMLSSCEDRQQPNDAPTLVAALPLTGDLSFLGTPGRAALDIAREDAAKMGAPFQVKLDDTKGDPAETATVLRRELDVGGNKFFLVTLSGPSLAAREIVKPQTGMLMSVAIHPGIPSHDRPVVRFCLSAGQEGRMLVERLAQSRGSLALVVSRDAATAVEVEKTILPGLKASGRQPAWVEWFDVGQQDFRTLAARFRTAPPEQILLLGYGSDFGNVLRALASTGSHKRVQIVGGIGFVELNRVPDGFQAQQFSFLAPAFSLGLGGPEAKAFRDRFSKATGNAASYDAAYTYDAAMTFARLHKAGRTTPDAMIAALRGSKFRGVTGEIAIDAAGETTTDMRWGGFDAAGRVVPRS